MQLQALPVAAVLWSGHISSDLRRPGVEEDSAPHQRRRAPRSLREVAVPVPLRPAPLSLPSHGQVQSAAKSERVTLERCG